MTLTYNLLIRILLFTDSFFTERYIPMGGDYLRALQESDLTSRVENIKNRNLMIVHGTADLFIHQEHSLMLARALIDHDVKFRHQVTFCNNFYHLKLKFHCR